MKRLNGPSPFSCADANGAATNISAAAAAPASTDFLFVENGLPLLLNIDDLLANGWLIRASGARLPRRTFQAPCRNSSANRGLARCNTRPRTRARPRGYGTGLRCFCDGIQRLT